MIEIIILFLLLVWSKSERDMLAKRRQDTLFPKWSWYVEDNWNTKSWWIKNPLSFLMGGWYLWEAVNVFISCYFVALSFDLTHNWIEAIALYGVFGLIHNIHFNSLFRKNLNV